MLIHIKYARKLNYCTKGIKLFCDKYNISLKDFQTKGVPEEEFLATDCTLAKRLVNEAKKSEGYK